MGMKRRHTLDDTDEESYLDQYVASFDYTIGLERQGVPGQVIDYCDKEVPDDDWDWHFKITGTVPDERSLYHGDVETEGCVSFRYKRHALEFWWWYQQQEIL